MSVCLNTWHRALFNAPLIHFTFQVLLRLPFHREWYHKSVLNLHPVCFPSVPPQEKEGEFHSCWDGGWWSPGVRPSSFLTAGHQGHALAPPLCSATVPQLAGESHRQRGGGAGWWQEGRLRDPEETGEGPTLTTLNQHRGTPQSCRWHSGPDTQFGGIGGRCWHHQRCYYDGKSFG